MVLFAMFSCVVSAQTQIEIVPNIPHSIGIKSAAVSSDGKLLVSGGSDNTIKVWDTATGRLLRTLEGHGHSERMDSVAFSPDGARIASAADRTIGMWDTATGKTIRSWKAHTLAVKSVVYSPDGTRLFSVGSESQWGNGIGHFGLWDATNGKLIRSFKDPSHVVASDSVNSAAFSPDGTRLVLAFRDKALQLWDITTGQLMHDLQGHSSEVMAVAFSPDGTRLVSGSREEPLKLWDVASGQLIRTFGNSHWIICVAFSPDGARVLAGGPGGARLWDVASGQRLLSLTKQHDHELPVEAVMFLPDGRNLVTAADQLRLWDAASGQLVRSFAERSRPILSVAFSPDGTQLLSGGGDRMLKLWDAANGQLTKTLAGHTGWVRSVAFSPDGTRLASGAEDMTLRLWDTASGQPVRAFTGHSRSVDSVAFSPDATQVLSGSPDHTLKLWDAASSKLVRTFEGHTGWVTSVSFSPDGTRLLSGGQIGLAGDLTFKLWDATTGRVIHAMAGNKLGVYGGAAFSRDGRRLLSGAGDGEVKLWDASSGQLIRSLTGHSGPVTSAVFSPGDAKVFSGSWDKTIKLWDAASGQLIRSFEGHQGSVYSIALSPDGTRVLSGGSDTTMRLWNTATGEQLAMLLATSDGEWLVITPEGFFDASANGAQILSAVRSLEVFSIDQFYQALYRPDLVREKLAGDPNGKVRAAAAKLDLTKLVDSGRAPHIVITSHQPENMSTDDLVTMEARLTDRGGGIGRAEWRINGITVGVAEKAAGSPGQPVTLRQAMALDPGENTVELTAYNSAGLVAAIPARAKITWTGKEPTVPPRLFVMVVGINDYLDGALKLTYAVPDATTLAAALERAGQGHYQDVIVTKVLDGDATAAKLDAVFADLATKVRPRDVFMFFAAGHGKTSDGRYYFIPYDLRYRTEQSLTLDAIGQDRLQAWFARIPAKKAVLMFDTCEAGSLTEHKVASRGLEQKAALGRLIQATGRATLTASNATQAAYEGYGGHGVFTFALLDALARADTNGNGLVELAELIQYVDGLVPAITEKRWGAKQYPQMDAYGSNFSLVRQVAALAPDQGDAIIIPIKPTHVSTELLSIFQEAGGRSAAVQQLPPFTTVTLVKSDRGWLLIARDGKLLGYAAEAKLHKLN
jgi:WD40 repeat protein